MQLIMHNHVLLVTSHMQYYSVFILQREFVFDRLKVRFNATCQITRDNNIELLSTCNQNIQGLFILLEKPEQSSMKSMLNAWRLSCCAKRLQVIELLKWKRVTYVIA